MNHNSETNGNKILAFLTKKHITQASKKAREAFLENLSILYESGMGIADVLKTLSKESKEETLQHWIGELRDQIEKGSPLWAALEKTGMLEGHYIELVRIGEDSGQLNKNLKAIVTQQKKEREFHSKIRSATLYPLLVLGVTLMVGISITWFVLPRLSLVFNQMNLDLPFLSRLLLGMGLFLQEKGWWVIPLFILGTSFLTYFIFYYKKTKHLGQSLLMHIPVSKKLIMQMELARFGYIGGTLLNAGMPVEKVMDALERSTDFLAYKNFYRQFKQNIERGASFKQGFEEYKNSERLIPVSVQQMINSAYYSGHLAISLERIGESYESKMEITTKNLPVILEPILLLVIWLGVVMVAMAVILPIYSLIGGFSAENSA